MDNINALRQKALDKVEEIRASIAAALSINLGTMSAADKADLDEEVEQAIEQWTESENEDPPPEPKTDLQKLLRTHYELCEQIMDAQDEANNM